MNLEILKNIETIKALPVHEKRKAILKPLINHLQSKIETNEPIDISFICTHNSRRSHLGQIWFQTLAHHFGIKNVNSYSGGTEETAVAKKIIETLKKQGFGIEIIAATKNPIYSIKYDVNYPSIIGFSKDFTNSFNAKTDFIAVLVCSQVNESCPFVSGAEKRFAITYEDPKLFDNTDKENEKYLERSTEIASEMYYVLSKSLQPKNK